MPISVVCSGCGRKLVAKDSLGGRIIPCPNCQTRVAVPDEPDEEQGDLEYRLTGKPKDSTPKSTFTPTKRSAASNSGDAEPGTAFDAAFAKPFKAAPPPKPAAPLPRAVAEEADEVDEADEDDDEEFVSRRRRRKRRAAAKEPDESEPDESEPDESEPAGFDLSRYLYLLIAVTMLPLAVHLATSKTDDVEARLEQTRMKHPELAAELTAETLTTETLLRLPEHKLEGAFLPYDSLLHWGLGAAAIVVFLGLIVGLLPRGDSHPAALVGAGIFTGTIGLAFLILVQYLAALSLRLRHIRGRAAIFVLLLMFIAFSYRAALDPEMSFLPSLFGFMFGVGLCEELVKSLPIIFAQRKWGLDWRGACAWGFASGVGFGIAEGIHYCGEHYNGVAPLGVYLVRFISCVGLHAMWSAVVGVMYWRNSELFDDDFEWTNLWPFLYMVLLIPMALHALYDTLLKKEMQLLALVTAVGSFIVMAAVIEWTAAGERAAMEES